MSYAANDIPVWTNVEWNEQNAMKQWNDDLNSITHFTTWTPISLTVSWKPLFFNFILNLIMKNDILVFFGNR